MLEGLAVEQVTSHIPDRYGIQKRDGGYTSALQVIPEGGWRGGGCHYNTRERSGDVYFLNFLLDCLEHNLHFQLFIPTYFMFYYDINVLVLQCYFLSVSQSIQTKHSHGRLRIHMVPFCVCVYTVIQHLYFGYVVI